MTTKDETDERRVAPAELKGGLTLSAGRGVRLNMGGAGEKQEDGGGPGAPGGAPATAAQEQPPALPGTPLRDPRWTRAKRSKDPAGARAFADGEAGVLEVAAPGLDGRTVRFSVEEQQGGSWRSCATVTAAVAGGVARAGLVLRHPLKDAARTPQARRPRHAALRFRAELI